MTETLQDRLRAAADVYSEHPPIFGLFFEAADALDLATTARRAFLERAVCHPGPPLSETEDYDPEAPLGELEAAILERLDHETEDRRDLWDIRKRCEEALGQTPDPARKTMQVVRDLLAQPTAIQRLNEQCRDRRAAERVAADLVPTVRPEHFAGPFPAISGYVKRIREARAAVVDQALGMLGEGQRLAVHDESERVDILFLDPGQDPPLGQTWTIYGPLSAEYREAFNASLDRQRCAATGGELRPAVAAGMATLRANSADRSPGPLPKAEEWQKLIDGLRNKHEGALNIEGSMASIKDAPPLPAVTLDPVASDLPNGKVAFKVRVAPELAAAVERQREEDGAARLRRTMAEASAEHEGDDATRRMYRPMMEMYRPMMETRRRQTYRPGSPIPERAPADYHPAEASAEHEGDKATRRMYRPDETSAVEYDTELVMPLDIMVHVLADIDTLPNIGGPAQASIMWARLPIWNGPATVELRFDNRLIDVTEFGDRTARYEQESRGIGTIWLALDPKTAARVLEYVGRGVDHPVMLCVVWAGHPVQFGASLAKLADGECAPEAQHIGAGREWHGYTIAVDKYPDLAARLFNERNQASARPREE